MNLTQEQAQQLYARIERGTACNPNGFRKLSTKARRPFTIATEIARIAFDLQPDPPPVLKPPLERSAFSAVVERLTNWQRKRWARSGYPGLRKKDATKVEPFTQLWRAA